MSRVLIVHADREVARARAAAVRRRGHEPVVLTSGERAMDSFIQEPADVVVIDFHLDGRDGLSTAEAIRWMPGGRRARVVLTADVAPVETPLLELGRSIDAFRALSAPSPGEVAAAVDEAARMRPHDAETRVLEVEQVLLAAERARGGHRWEETTAPVGDALKMEDETFDDPEPADWEWRDTDGRAEGREVRALAEDAARRESELVGTFDIIPFARLLHRMADKRATGALVCVHPPDERATTEGTEPTKVVYFRAGVPVAVRSNLVSECLGQVLARTRRIGPATLRESLMAVRRGEGLQGEVLVRMGALSPLDVSEALADQLRFKLFELFAWRRGTFRFAAERAPPRELIDLGLGLAEIAFLGIREGMPPARVLERLAPERERYVIPRPRELVRFVRMHVPGPLHGVIRRIDGTQRLRELLESSGDPAGAAQLVYAMACLMAVRFDAKPLTPLARGDDGEEWDEATPRIEEPSSHNRATRVVRAGDVQLGEGRFESGDPRGEEGPAIPAAGARAGDTREPSALESVTGPDGASGDDEGRPTLPDAPRGAESDESSATHEPASMNASESHADEVGEARALPPTRPARPAPKSSGESALPSDVPPAGSADAAGAGSEHEDRATKPSEERGTVVAKVSARAHARTADLGDGESDQAREQGTVVAKVGAKGGVRPGATAAAANDSRDGGANGASNRTDPATNRSEPATSRNEPASNRTDPASNRTDPATNRTDPATNRTEPASNRNEPATNRSDPATNRSEPASNRTEPASNRNEPASNRNKPATNRSEPATNRSEPATNRSDPAINRSDPASDSSVDRQPASNGSEPAADSSVGTEPAPADPRVLDQRVERLLAAERHFRRGQRALDRDRPTEAEKAFARAAELCPDEGRFVAHLGWAKHASSPDDAGALTEALELAERGCLVSPELAVAHLLRGRLLRAGGRDDEARAAFARVLELESEQRRSPRVGLSERPVARVPAGPDERGVSFATVTVTGGGR